MKTFTIAIFTTTIVFLAISAASLSFVSDVSIKDFTTAQSPTGQVKAPETKVSDQQVEPNPTVKVNSFSVGKILGEEQGNITPAKAMVHRGKMYLLKQVDNRVAQLDPFKDRIESMTKLSDSERQSLVLALDTEIVKFEALKTEISRSATKEDIKTVADKVKTEWIKSRLSVEHAKEAVLALNETQLVSDANIAETGMQKHIAVLKAAGKDTKPYEKLLAAYSKKIASAAQDLQSANMRFSTKARAVTDDEKQKLIKGNGLLLASSQNSIREAYTLLKDGAREDFARRFK